MSKPVEPVEFQITKKTVKAEIRPLRVKVTPILVQDEKNDDKDTK